MEHVPEVSQDSSVSAIVVVQNLKPRPHYDMHMSQVVDINNNFGPEF